MLTAWLGTLNFLIHYVDLSSVTKAETFFIIEIFRFSLFYMICYYYCAKASGLLTNQRLVIYLLRALFCVGIALINLFGIIFIVQVNEFEAGEGGMNPRNLCEEFYFQLYRYFPLVIQLVFYLAYLDIRKKIKSHSRESYLEKKIYSLQSKTLKRLRKVLLIFFLSNIWINAWDIIAKICADNSNSA